MKSTSFSDLLHAHPAVRSNPVADRAALLAALGSCATACTVCADACLSETPMLERLRPCIRLNLDCADLCAATARLVARAGEPATSLLHVQLHACVLACQECADECARHADHHTHCGLCADECRHCQELCNLYLGAISSSGLAEAGPPPAGR
jgi:hypothetical protein